MRRAPGTETMVRMGELAVSATPGDMLVSIGLGSCIGLALVDARRGVAGLAHIMLPGDNGAFRGDAVLAKYANEAVPELVDRLLVLGAVKRQLEAVLVGGAQMFTNGGSGLDIGTRNEEATRQALEHASIPIRAAATAGSSGRTIRVQIAPVRVTSKEVGGQEVALYSGVGSTEPPPGAGLPKPANGAQAAAPPAPKRDQSGGAGFAGAGAEK